MVKNSYRMLGFIEGISLLVLFCIAMPLKYFAGKPEAVSVVGMIHGVLFSLYAVGGLVLLDALGWSYKKLALALVISSVPFGPFLFDRKLFPESSAAAGSSI